MLQPRSLVLLGCLALLLAACSADPQPAADSPRSVASPTPTSQRPHELPPVPGDDGPPPSSRPAEPPRTTADENGFTRSCGIVRAASGARLQVILGEGVTDCPMAVRLVRAFHRAIAGEQPSGSRHPAKATVDGWSCVSGPPSSQGGTNCTRGERTVMAAVVTDE